MASYVLNDGVALRYKVLSDGRRQVRNLRVPGDLIGLPAGLFESAIASVSGLTDTTVSPIKFEELFSLFRHYPRIATALFWTSAQQVGLIRIARDSRSMPDGGALMRVALNAQSGEEANAVARRLAE